jgi:hypothetical protein
MPDGRSLCDRVAFPRLRDVEPPAEEQLQACGSCVNLAGFLRRQAIIALERTNGRVDPPTVVEGWSNLRGTRWDVEIDLDRFLTRDFSSDQYDAIRLEVDPQRIRDDIDEENRAIEEFGQAREDRSE